MTKLDIISSKIITIEILKFRLAYWRTFQKKIVFTNGCFDILHFGHIDYLSKASDLGHILIIGLNSDESVKRLKGMTRPINKQTERALMLAALQFVNNIVVFEEDTPEELIKFIKPDVIVKGNEYKPEEIAGADFVIANGGEVVTIELTKGFSTSILIEKLINK